jgi:hypothetical protein
MRAVALPTLHGRPDPRIEPLGDLLLRVVSGALLIAQRRPKCGRP